MSSMFQLTEDNSSRVCVCAAYINDGQIHYLYKNLRLIKSIGIHLRDALVCRFNVKGAQMKSTGLIDAQPAGFTENRP